MRLLAYALMPLRTGGKAYKAQIKDTRAMILVKGNSLRTALDIIRLHLAMVDWRASVEVIEVQYYQGKLLAIRTRALGLKQREANKDKLARESLGLVKELNLQERLGDHVRGLVSVGEAMVRLNRSALVMQVSAMLHSLTLRRYSRYSRYTPQASLLFPTICLNRFARSHTQTFCARLRFNSNIKRRRTEARAAAVLQRAWRRDTRRRQLADAYLTRRAVKIQRVFRRHLARKAARAAAPPWWRRSVTLLLRRLSGRKAPPEYATKRLKRPARDASTRRSALVLPGAESALRRASRRMSSTSKSSCGVLTAGRKMSGVGSRLGIRASSSGSASAPAVPALTLNDMLDPSNWTDNSQPLGSPVRTSIEVEKPAEGGTCAEAPASESSSTACENATTLGEPVRVGIGSAPIRKEAELPTYDAVMTVSDQVRAGPQIWARETCEGWSILLLLLSVADADEWSCHLPYPYAASPAIPRCTQSDMEVEEMEEMDTHAPKKPPRQPSCALDDKCQETMPRNAPQPIAPSVAAEKPNKETAPAVAEVALDEKWEDMDTMAPPQRPEWPERVSIFAAKVTSEEVWEDMDTQAPPQRPAWPERVSIFRWAEEPACGEGRATPIQERITPGTPSKREVRTPASLPAGTLTKAKAGVAKTVAEGRCGTAAGKAPAAGRASAGGSSTTGRPSIEKRPQQGPAIKSKFAGKSIRDSAGAAVAADRMKKKAEESKVKAAEAKANAEDVRAKAQDKIAPATGLSAVAAAAKLKKETAKSEKPESSASPAKSSKANEASSSTTPASSKTPAPPPGKAPAASSSKSATSPPGKAPASSSGKAPTPPSGKPAATAPARRTISTTKTRDSLQAAMKNIPKAKPGTPPLSIADIAKQAKSNCESRRASRSSVGDSSISENVPMPVSGVSELDEGIESMVPLARPRSASKKPLVADPLALEPCSPSRPSSAESAKRAASRIIDAPSEEFHGGGFALPCSPHTHNPAQLSPASRPGSGGRPSSAGRSGQKAKLALQSPTPPPSPPLLHMPPPPPVPSVTPPPSPPDDRSSSNLPKGTMTLAQAKAAVATRKAAAIPSSRASTPSTDGRCNGGASRPSTGGGAGSRGGASPAGASPAGSRLAGVADAAQKASKAAQGTPPRKGSATAKAAAERSAAASSTARATPVRDGSASSSAARDRREVVRARKTASGSPVEDPFPAGPPNASPSTSSRSSPEPPPTAASPKPPPHTPPHVGEMHARITFDSPATPSKIDLSCSNSEERGRGSASLESERRSVPSMALLALPRRPTSADTSLRGSERPSDARRSRGSMESWARQSNGRQSRDSMESVVLAPVQERIPTPDGARRGGAGRRGVGGRPQSASTARDFRRVAATQLTRGLQTLRPWSGGRGRQAASLAAKEAVAAEPWVPSIVKRRAKVAMAKRKLNRDIYVPSSKMAPGRCELGHAASV